MPSTEIPNRAETSDEAELVERLLAGDADAFEALVESQTPRLLAVTRRILQCEEDAQDAVQDAFVAAFRSLDTFQRGSRVSTWLYRIAINAALMKLRARTRRREDPIDGSPAPLGFQTAPVALAPQPRADELLEQGETRALVRACIDRLPESYRTVLVLRDLEGLGTAEAAPILGVSNDALKMRLHRARQALRKLLEPHVAGAHPAAIP
jgi:RNA polymerase sigma-70 factor (ECF subfamily)